MKSETAKVLHPVGGRPMLAYLLDLAEDVDASRTVVVVGHQAEAVRAFVGKRAASALQDPPRGTGDAARCALAVLPKFTGVIVILNGDTPLLRSSNVRSMLDAHRASQSALSVAVTRLASPAGYGRVLRDSGGGIMGIVEERDATDEQRTMCEINAGVYVAEAAFLRAALTELKADNAQGEYYLTDIVGLAAAQGRAVRAYDIDRDDVIGVNSRADLAHVERLMRMRICERWMDAGVTILDPSRTWIDSTVTIGRDSVLAPGAWLEGATTVGETCVIGAGSHLIASRLGDGVVIKDHCVMEGAQIDDGATVGPFAHLRPGSVLRRGAKVGNFVELKRAELGIGAKANHLSYLGDAAIGAHVNVGAGTITCNYDGIKKSRTIVEDNVFVGSDSQLIAPVRIGKGAVIAAGTTVTEDVPANALAIGRVKPVVKANWASRRRGGARRTKRGTR